MIMSNKGNSSPFGLSIMSVLTLIFIVLKLTNLIDWSWWWITAPLWGGLVVALLVLAFILILKVLWN